MSVAKQTAATFSATVATRALGIATMFFSRRFLGPEQAGLWALVQLTLGYILAFHSGIVTGAEREIPYVLGQGNDKQANAVRRQMFSAALLEAGISSLCVLSFVTFNHGAYRGDLRLGLYLLGVCVVLSRLAESFLIALRTIREFVQLARLQMFFAFCEFVLLWTLVRPFKLTGQYAGFGIILIIKCLMYWRLTRRQSGWSFRPLFDKTIMGPLFRTGFPLVINNLLWVGWSSIDSLFVAKKLGLVALGLYSIGVSVSRAAGEIPLAFSTVIYPHLMNTFGAKDDSRYLGLQVYRYLKAAVCVFSPIIVCGIFFLIPLGTQYIIPKFSPAIPCIKILVFGGLFLSLTNISNCIFIAKKKTIQFSMITLVVGLATSVILWKSRVLSIQSTAWAMAIAQMTYFSGVTFLALHKTLGAKTAFRSTAVLLLGIFYVAVVVWSVSLIAFSNGGAPTITKDILQTLSRIGLSTLLFTPLFFIADKDLSLFSRTKEVLRWFM